MFIALEPDYRSRKALSETVALHERDRTPTPSNLHLTLSFLGERETAEDLIEAFETKIGEVKHLSAYTEGFCLFGSAFAASVRDDGAIKALKDRVDEAIGFREKRLFVPHITLSRKGVRVESSSKSVKVDFAALTLFRSDFKENRTVYTPLKSVLIKPAKRFDTVLFDLDGTLTDSAPGIKRSLKYALDKMGVSGYEPGILDKFLGPPLVWSYKTYLGLSDELAAEGLRLYRENYNEMGGKYLAEVYPGIEELLKRLKKGGARLAVATVKPEQTAREVLEHFGLLKYFDCVSGGQPEERKADKKSVIEEALRRIGKRADDSVLMVGDRVYDIEGGIAAGVKTLGVAYGFGGYGELKDAGADYIAATAKDISELFYE